MNIDEILLLKYPDEIRQGKIKFVEENDDQGVVISHWDMPVPQPSRDEILSYESSLEFQKQIVGLKEIALHLIKELIHSTASEKGYDSAESCASYSASTIALWASEAQAFIAWRDLVYKTAIDSYNAIENGAPIPDPNEFINSLPKITWP